MDLSVVMPVRNVASTITDQLTALRSQRWDGEWEVVVVDNQSTDATAALVDAAASVDPRVRRVGAPDRAGLSYTRNVGVQAARSDHVAICDGDDVVGEGWVAAMGDALAEHRFVTGPLDATRLNPPWLATSRGSVSRTTAPATFYGVFGYASGGNLGIERGTWEQIGRFAEGIPGTEDIEFSLRAWLLGVELHFVPEALLHYRFRPGAKDLWRQGRSYGAGRPLIRRRLLEAGRPRPPWWAGWRSWAWLVVHLPELRSGPGRARWTWVAANRVGHLEGSVRYRCLFP